MTGPQKILIRKLLSGCLLRKTTRRKKPTYTLYDKNINPISVIRAKTVESIDRYLDPKIKLWKKDKWGNITLNLSTIRQLHGKNTIKRLYKSKDNLSSAGTIYKQKKRSSKKTESNEKVHYLF